MLDFIDETLKKTAKAVEGLNQPTDADYTDVKGYLVKADMLAHALITNEVHSKYPSDNIYSEESPQESVRRHKKGSRTWILDPICGTANYVRGIPFYVHSLCVVDDEGVLAGGVYHSGVNELFLADRNRTTLNGKVVRVSDVKELDEAIVAVNCNQAACQNNQNALVVLTERLAPPVTRRLRIMESANLELAYIACGRIDGYVNLEDKVWDIAVGSLMIKSAGGVFSTYRGSLHEFSSCRGVIAGNRQIGAKLEALVRREEKAL